MNAVQIIGRLTKDIELRHGNSGTAFASFTLAVNRSFKKDGEERQADFITCKAFSKTAEFIGQYFQKGSMLAIEGRIQTGSYDKDGTKVYTTDVMVERAHFTGEKTQRNEIEPQPQQQAGFFPVDNGEDELPF